MRGRLEHQNEGSERGGGDVIHVQARQTNVALQYLMTHGGFCDGKRTTLGSNIWSWQRPGAEVSILPMSAASNDVSPLTPNE